MRKVSVLLVVCGLVASCDASTGLTAADLELFKEGCDAIKSNARRVQCLAALERARGEGKPKASSTAGAGNTSQTREIISFKDVQLGQPGVKTALTEICRQDKSNESSYEPNRCDFPKRRGLIWLSYGNLEHSLANIEIGDDDALQSVEIGESKASLLGLVETLRERYGQPKKTVLTVENKMGTKFENEVFVWTDSRGNMITVETIYDKVDRGRVTIESASRVLLRGAAEKAAKEMNKSRL